MIPSNECSYCNIKLTNNSTVYMGWNRIFCSTYCRANYHNRREKSYLELIHYFILRSCGL